MPQTTNKSGSYWWIPGTNDGHLEVVDVVLDDFAGAVGELGGVTGKEVGRDMMVAFKKMVRMYFRHGSVVNCHVKTTVPANLKNLFREHPAPSNHGNSGKSLFC